LGEIDGEEFGDGECSLFVQTNAVEKAKKVIRRFLDAQKPKVPYRFATS